MDLVTHRQPPPAGPPHPGSTQGFDGPLPCEESSPSPAPRLIGYVPEMSKSPPQSSRRQVSLSLGEILVGIKLVFFLMLHDCYETFPL